MPGLLCAIKLQVNNTVSEQCGNEVLCTFMIRDTLAIKKSTWFRRVLDKLGRQKESQLLKAVCCGITCHLCSDVFVDKCDIKKFRRKKKPHFLKAF